MRSCFISFCDTFCARPLVIQDSVATFVDRAKQFAAFRSTLSMDRAIFQFARFVSLGESVFTVRKADIGWSRWPTNRRIYIRRWDLNYSRGAGTALWFRIPWDSVSRQIAGNTRSERVSERVGMDKGRSACIGSGRRVAFSVVRLFSPPQIIRHSGKICFSDVGRPALMRAHGLRKSFMNLSGSPYNDALILF